MIFELNPRALTPLLDIRSANQERIRQLAAQIDTGAELDPVCCFEKQGYFLIVDGHHEWAAHLLSERMSDIKVELLDRATLSSRTPFAPDTIYQEVKWSTVSDWEDALKIRLLNGAYEESLNFLPLTILSGPSGVGKTRIIAELRKQGTRISNMRTTTTRSRREGEEDGVDYDFVAEQEFRERVKKKGFCEWQVIHGHLYGSRWDLLFPKEDVGLRIKDLDAFGTLQIKSLYPSSVRAVFMVPSSFEILRQRIVDRCVDDASERVRRLTRTRMEFELAHAFDFMVTNDEIACASEQVYRLASTRIAAREPTFFLDDATLYGRYVAIDVNVGAGQTLVWANLRDRSMPLLRLNGYCAEDMGFRLLEMIVINQLWPGLAKVQGGADIMRILISKLDAVRPEQLSGLGKSRKLAVSVKRVDVPALAGVLVHDSPFFEVGAKAF